MIEKSTYYFPIPINIKKNYFPKPEIGLENYNRLNHFVKQSEQLYFG